MKRVPTIYASTLCVYKRNSVLCLEESIYLFGCIATAISFHNLYHTIAIMSIVNKKSVVLFACFKNKA